MFEKLKARGFQVEVVSHAEAILSVDFADCVTEVENVLLGLEMPIQEIVGSGGGETKGTQRLRRALAAIGWKKANFTIEKTINGVKRESQSHQVDHVRQVEAGTIALEIEWNNKDPFFDRDLENFKRLHAEGGISAGIIVTRGAKLQEQMLSFVRRFANENGITSFAKLEKVGLKAMTARQRASVKRKLDRGTEFAEAWTSVFVSDKYGAATTHWGKLEARVARGVGNPCPLVLIGLPDSMVTFGKGKVEQLEDED